jgi:hypothetical protein
MSGWDALSEEAREKLGAWPVKARELFTELVEDASTEMQRELLQRAVAAGHSPAEVHAFADELRGLPDEKAFDACTLDADAPEGYTVVQLLRAEADPLYAYELKGNTLSPADEPEAAPKGLELGMPYVVPTASHPSPVQKRSTFDSGSQAKLQRAPQPVGFGADSGRHKRMDLNDLGESIDASPRARPAPSGSVAAVSPAAGSPAVTAKLMEDLINEVARPLGITYREQDVDDAALPLEAALQSASTAVGRGVPVPVALGPALGQHRRLALLLQTSMASGKRAWQLFDPHSGELHWVSEGDLLARSELPFTIKTNRRITRIALPTSKATQL